MVPGIDNLGEQALNKIAEVALSTQLDEADNLEVEVKTDPGKLAQGELESLAIDGEGLVMQEDLRMQKMQIQMNSIAVNPMKALMGNIELTKPTEGKAQIVLTEEDINRAFNSEILSDRMQNLQIELDKERVTIDTERVDCHLLADGKIAIDAEIKVQQTGENKQVSFQTTPHVSTDGRAVVLAEVEYQEGKELSPELTKALLAKAREILTLSNFEMEGISLRIQQLEVNSGKLILQAVANVTQFPSN
ncbi:LmeA family phospholipid-binding protein [Oscillatoria salina]|uniref:LmeA family phospholipid-binding protein n=1 Tax=Oscillatoria salina TaxID=331517 RepID=UPI0013B636D1|nr:DUF2993 domain-containing protein [Oscillatoria salina]MBZ8179444.1 DUF2993 domain-containing protein [Oscillatoria salina IIICB1]NET90881.1 DUF2993 domain-containing protein [Kamptonema sp. SIO1D9]